MVSWCVVFFLFWRRENFSDRKLIENFIFHSYHMKSERNIRACPFLLLLLFFHPRYLQQLFLRSKWETFFAVVQIGFINILLPKVIRHRQYSRYHMKAAWNIHSHITMCVWCFFFLLCCLALAKPLSASS